MSRKDRTLIPGAPNCARRAIAKARGMTTVKLNGDMRVLEESIKHTGKVKLANSSSVPALTISLGLRDAKTGRRVLPEYYEDNYFSLLLGESRRIRIEGLPYPIKPEVELTAGTSSKTVKRRESD